MKLPGIVAAALSVLAAGCVPGPARNGIVDLAPRKGAVAELRIAGREAPRVALDLPSRHWLRLAVRQEGVDVVVRVLDPSGDEILTVDSPTGRQEREPVAFLAPRGGVHKLLLEGAGRGSVRVEVVESRPAGDGDAARFAATRALARGTLHWIAGERPAAEEELRRALAGFLSLGGDPAEADARRWLAAVLAAEGRLEQAAALLADAVAQLAEQGEGHEAARARIQLADLWRRLGQGGEAERELLAARDDLSRAGRCEELALTLTHLGALWSDDGQLGRAESALSEAVRLRRSLGDRCALSASERWLGALYALIGRDEAAREVLAAALADAEGCAPRVRSAALVESGWARFLAGDADGALLDLGRALDLAREAGDRRLRTTVFDRRGTVLTSTGRHAAARRNYLEALAEVEGTDDYRAHGAVIANLGRLARLAGDAGGAAHLLRRALAVLAAAGDAEGEAFTGLELARALRALGRPARAERELARAIERVETVRAGLPSTASRSAFLAHRREIYDELIDLLMLRAASNPEGGHQLAALEVAERARARSLLDSVTAAGRPTASAETRRAVMAEVARLDGERARLRGRGAPRERIVAVERRLGRLTRLAERLAAPPSQPAERLLTAAGVAGVLDPDTDLLVFSLGAARSYSWLVDAGGAVEWFALPAAATLEGFARRAAAELARRPDDGLPLPSGGASAALARRLLADVAPRLDTRRLAVVPDGALHLVPFQALPLPGGSGDLLLDRVEVVVVPSPTALARQRARTVGARPAGVLVVADPVFSAADPRAGGEPALPAAPLPADLERSMSDLDLARLPRLRWTRREAQAIAAAARPGRSRLLVDFAADRRRLLAGDLARHRVLHFATHALLHPDDPQLSGIVLSLVGPEGRPRDGFLRAWEISALDLPVELAVLSACSTALGREVRAEGLVGLPQAFFRAGVRRVVVSHWPVQDRATAELMAVFYDRLLRRGQGPAAALAAAQRALRRDPRWSAPYFWAGFSLQGDWRPLAAEQNRP